MAEAAEQRVKSRSFIDPKALMRIRNLELRARIVVQGFWNGLHRSPYHGFSVEFTEYRQYSVGDDTRYMDWRLYARSDRFYIKKFEDETNLRCFLVVDNSRSMQFGSQAYTKAEYANTLAATLAQFLFNQGDAVGLLTFDNRILEYLPARNRPGHLRSLMLALEKTGSAERTDFADPLLRIPALTNRRGLIVILSDFLAPLDSLANALSTLTASGHEVVAFQVLDSAEMNLTFSTPAIFEDLESKQQLYIDPDGVRESYQKKFRAHNAQLRSLCQKVGVVFEQVVSDRFLELALFDFLRTRLQRGRVVRRRSSPGSRA